MQRQLRHMMWAVTMEGKKGKTRGERPQEMMQVCIVEHQASWEGLDIRVSCTSSKAESKQLCDCVAGGEGDETDEEETNVEPTQAYNFDGDAEDEEEQPMDCEPTVAYNITGMTRRMPFSMCAHGSPL